MNKQQEALDRVRRFVHPYRITDGGKFRLSDIDPADTGGLKSADKQEAGELMRLGIEWLADLQDKLYAQNRRAVLLIFQAMDAAGKDGTIKHVMSGVNPQGCQVYSFKEPSVEDLDHDYMWRHVRCLPERGRIGIFNRSYYEEVLIVRVHDELLTKQRIPEELVTKHIWRQRLEDIAAFERYLQRNGTVILKFFLHVSKKEQKRRFIQRLERPEKNWKFSSGDLHERQYWGEYMQAYEDAIRHTATSDSPWFVVPADNKWYTRLVVAAAVVECLQSLDLRYPKVDQAMQAELAEAKEILLGGDDETALPVI